MDKGWSAGMPVESVGLPGETADWRGGERGLCPQRFRPMSDPRSAEHLCSGAGMSDAPTELDLAGRKWSG